MTSSLVGCIVEGAERPVGNRCVNGKVGGLYRYVECWRDDGKIEERRRCLC